CPVSPAMAWAAPPRAASPSNTTAPSPAPPRHAEPASRFASRLTGRRASPGKPGVSPDPKLRLGQLRQTASVHERALAQPQLLADAHRSHQGRTVMQIATKRGYWRYAQTARAR